MSPSHLFSRRSAIFRLTVLFCLFSFRMYAQQEQERPYNRFQFHKYKWVAFHTAAFHIYFPRGYDSTCSFIAGKIVPAMERAKKEMGGSLQKIPNIIIYPSGAQLYESNIGGFDAQQYTLPTVVLKGTRLVLAYNGSYEDLENQLKEAIVRATWEAQFRGDLEEQLKGAKADEKIPLWFKEGAIRYFAYGWPLAAENALKRSFKERVFSDWQQSVGWQPRLSGQAFCYFLTEQYYPQAVRQLYTQLKKKGSLARAVRLIAKHPADSLYKQCFQFYSQRFAGEGSGAAVAKDSLPVPLKKGILKQVLSAPGKSDIAYIISGFHKRTVWVYNVKAAKAHALISYQLPPWIGDHAANPYPIIEWLPDGSLLSVVMPVKGKIHILKYGTGGSLQQNNTLYGVDGVNALKPLDRQEYLLKAYKKGQSGIVYFNDRKEKYSGMKDSAVMRQYGLESWIENEMTVDTTGPWWVDKRRRQAEQAKEDSILNAAKSNEPSFLDRVLTPKGAKEEGGRLRDSVSRSLAYDPEKLRAYVLQLHSAYFTTKVNNDYFINRYQPYLNYQAQFKFPEVGGMARGGFTDLFEDHHFGIAYRLPAGADGSDFFVHYENTSRKTDWGLTWFRKVESLQPDPNRQWVDENGNPYPNAANVKTNYYELSLHVPVSYYLGISASTAIRNDRTIFLATERYTLNYDDIKSTWSITTIAANINKLQPTQAMLHKGLKAKLSLDLLKGFSQAKAGLYGIGMDVQYHQPVYKYITVVGRLQAGYSGGDEKLLYTFGGMDNNITPRVDTSVHFPQQAPYAFQTLITPLRGYRQNSLYGNQYLLFNADVYFPLFQTLYPLETPLQSLNLLQPGVFLDIAHARETWDPQGNNDVIASFGISARTSLAGYPLRFDIGWPGSFNKKPIWYLSLNLK